MKSAIGIVMPIVNTPQGLSASALTTTKPRPASAQKNEEDRDHGHEAGERTDLGAGDVGERAATVTDGGDQHGEVLHASGQHGADEEPEKAGSESELGGERRTDQRAGAGDGGEVMSEEHPARGRDVVVAVGVECGWEWCGDRRGRALWRR